MGRLPLVVWAWVVGAFSMGADDRIVAGVGPGRAQALDVSLSAVGHLCRHSAGAPIAVRVWS
jgi:predicted MFS family arabinose efflux permease